MVAASRRGAIEWGWFLGAARREPDDRSDSRLATHYYADGNWAEMSESDTRLMLARYLGAIAWLDHLVGILLDELDDLGIADDTLVIYTSDQGWYLGEHGWYDKRWMYEESFRTPFIVRWPDRIDGGVTSDLLAQNIDLAPTLLDLAGIDPPERMHGESFAAHLRSGGRATPEDWRDAVYYRYYESEGPHTVPKHDGIRTDRWKLIRFPEVDPDGDGPAGPGCWELYDLDADPDELKSLADDPAHAEIRAGLEARLEQLRLRYDA